MEVLSLLALPAVSYCREAVTVKGRVPDGKQQQKQGQQVGRAHERLALPQAQVGSSSLVVILEAATSLRLLSMLL